MKSYVDIPQCEWSCNAKDGVGYENIDFIQTGFIIESLWRNAQTLIGVAKTLISFNIWRVNFNL